jgi:hypothetical protein
MEAVVDAVVFVLPVNLTTFELNRPQWSSVCDVVFE